MTNIWNMFGGQQEGLGEEWISDSMREVGRFWGSSAWRAGVVGASRKEWGHSLETAKGLLWKQQTEPE